VARGVLLHPLLQGGNDVLLTLSHLRMILEDSFPQKRVTATFFGGWVFEVLLEANEYHTTLCGHLGKDVVIIIHRKRA
jgi:hypothetical protein